MNNKTIKCNKCGNLKSDNSTPCEHCEKNIKKITNDKLIKSTILSIAIIILLFVIQYILSLMTDTTACHASGYIPFQCLGESLIGFFLKILYLLCAFTQITLFILLINYLTNYLGQSNKANIRRLGIFLKIILILLTIVFAGLYLKFIILPEFLK